MLIIKIYIIKFLWYKIKTYICTKNQSQGHIYLIIRPPWQPFVNLLHNRAVSCEGHSFLHPGKLPLPGFVFPTQIFATFNNMLYLCPNEEKTFIIPDITGVCGDECAAEILRRTRRCDAVPAVCIRICVEDMWRGEPWRLEEVSHHDDGLMGCHSWYGMDSQAFDQGKEAGRQWPEVSPVRTYDDSLCRCHGPA